MTQLTPDIQAAAAAIFAARETLTQIPPVRESHGIADVEAAYAVQALNTARWIEAGRRPVGAKIGLTSKAVQDQLGVGEPDFGTLWADYAFGEGDVVPLRRFMQPKVEAEIAFVIGRRLDDPQISLTRLTGAIDCAYAAVEIVDSAIAAWNIRLADTVADNASGGGFALGTEPRRIGDVDLRLGGMVLTLNGRPASIGVGAACLGHPLNATLWLARRMAELGRPLEAGDIVLSGALGPMVPVAAGDVCTVEIQGFAPLSFVFGDKHP